MPRLRLWLVLFIVFPLSRESNPQLHTIPLYLQGSSFFSVLILAFR